MAFRSFVNTFVLAVKAALSSIQVCHKLYVVRNPSVKLLFFICSAILLSSLHRCFHFPMTEIFAKQDTARTICIGRPRKTSRKTKKGIKNAKSINCNGTL